MAGIYDITWNDVPFDALVLPSEKKDLLQALVQQTTTDLPDGKEVDKKAFDDFVEDKGLYHSKSCRNIFISALSSTEN